MLARSFQVAASGLRLARSKDQAATSSPGKATAEQHA